MIQAHFGPVVAGLYGPAGDQRFDVLGMTVNTAARLESRGVSLSVDTFRKLSPETRRRFQKHTAPTVYIPVGSDRPGS